MTLGQQYEAVEREKDLVRIRLPDGRLRRFPKLCFDLIPALVNWKFDDEIVDEIHQECCPAVSFTLSDGTRRWCILATPQFLIQYLEPPMPQPGFWASNLVVVRNYTSEVVEQALRHLDEQGNLVEASKLWEPLEAAEIEENLS